MTRQETFKRRVRERMAKTGERYTAARRVLLEQSNGSRRRTWVADPEFSNDAVVKATGKGWDDWVDIIEGWGDKSHDHPAIATRLAAEHGLDGWWSQSVTVGYERIVGIRLPYQRSDGTFTAGKSKTVSVGAAELRSMLLDDGARDDLFPGHHTELLSKTSAKAIRIGIGPGVAHFGLGSVDGGRTKVTVGHEKLPDYELVEEWKHYWDEWLDALEEAAFGV